MGVSHVIEVAARRATWKLEEGEKVTLSVME